MTGATYATARRHACPDGHRGPHGEPLTAMVPDGLDLAPACTVCRQPMTPASGPLSGTWRADDCCVPAGPGGTWAGPPRDPASCTRCHGTRKAVLCTRCLLPGCAGGHAGTCEECDGLGTVPCRTCDGEGHVYDQAGEDAGLCPSPWCTAGQVPCPACGEEPLRHRAVHRAQRPGEEGDRR
ncbi:MAG TPA: hypothetical protein VFO01_16560 [Trebonia sp.]|nr:hypothetical protein [Trebonia sp.]